MQKPLKYILRLGIEVILKKNAGSLKFVENFLMRKCGLKSRHQVKYTMNVIKAYINNKNNKLSDTDEEILNVLKEALND